MVIHFGILFLLGFYLLGRACNFAEECLDEGEEPSIRDGGVNGGIGVKKVHIARRIQLH